MAEDCIVNFSETPSTLSEQLFLDDLKNRKLVLDMPIGDDTFKLVGYYILRINAEDKYTPVEKRVPIKLYLACDGGNVIDGLNLINIINASKTPVHTIVVGQAYSMAIYIALCGHKRYAFPNSTFLFHDGSMGIAATQRKLRDCIDFNDRVDFTLDSLVIDKTKIEADELRDKSRVEWYMFADEAKEKGVIDYIVGVDCDLEEVV